MNMEHLWSDWPNREMDGLMKAYILTQLAFWLQQILVVNIEERRKDHWQMLTHHFITVSLIMASYRYRFTRVANVILILMDVSDFFLPVSRLLPFCIGLSQCHITDTKRSWPNASSTWATPPFAMLCLAASC